MKVLTGIATQGAVSKETQKAYYVNTFKLEVSTNGEDWMVYRHGKNHKVGQKNHSHTHTHYPVIRRTAEVLRAIRESLDALRGDTHAYAHAQKYETEYMSSER